MQKSLPLDSEHVADHVQILNVINLQEILRHRDKYLCKNDKPRNKIVFDSWNYQEQERVKQLKRSQEQVENQENCSYMKHIDKSITDKIVRPNNYRNYS